MEPIKKKMPVQSDKECQTFIMKIAFNNYNLILGQPPNICTIHFVHMFFVFHQFQSKMWFDSIFFVVLKFTNWELNKHTLKLFVLCVANVWCMCIGKVCSSSDALLPHFIVSSFPHVFFVCFFLRKWILNVQRDFESISIASRDNVDQTKTLLALELYMDRWK